MFVVAEALLVAVAIICAFWTLLPRAINGDGDAGRAALTLLHLVAWSGALGGLLHMITSFVSPPNSGPQDRTRRRVRLAFKPVVGAGLAVVVYFVMQTGLLSPVSSTPSEATVANAPSPNNATDVYRALAIACLTGLFARRAMDKLREVFFTLFQSGEKDGQNGLQGAGAQSRGGARP